MGSGGKKIRKKPGGEVSEAALAEQIKRQSERMQEFVYAVSHDLGSPLFSIQAFSMELSRYCDQLRKVLDSEQVGREVKDKAFSILESEVQGAVSYIQKSVKEMNTLLDSLKRLSRAGDRELNIERLDMNELVGGVVESMAEEIEKAGAAVEMGKLPGCFGDGILVEQVFGHLVSNSLRFLDRGRGGAIRISGRIEGQEAIYAVEDNGVGIADKHLEKIFEVFWRLESPGGEQGEGLGLTIARRIVERLNGRIRAESRLGEGSTFYVSLPKGGGR